MRWSSLCEKVHTVWTLMEHKSSHHFFGDVIRFGRCEFWKIHVLLSPRRALHKTNYLESDSLDEEKSDENTLLDNQDREEVNRILSNA